MCYDEGVHDNSWFGSEAKTDLKSSKLFEWPLWSMPMDLAGRLKQENEGFNIHG